MGAWAIWEKEPVNSKRRKEMSMPGGPDQVISLVYKLEDRPALARSVVLGFQHVVVMFTAMISEPLIIGAILKLPVEQIAMLLVATMIGCGIGSILQSNRIWFVGCNLPMVMGSFLLFVGPIVSIARVSGLAGAFTAMLVGALVQFLVVSFFFAKLRRFSPPLVTGTIITIIGLFLIPIGIQTALGVGTPHYNTPRCLIVSMLTVACIIVLNRFTRGLWKTISVLLGILFGYLISIPFGMLDISPVYKAAWIGIPRAFWYGPPVWPGITAVFIMVIAFIVTAVDVIGNTLAVSKAVEVEADEKRLRGAIAADGLASSISAVFGGSPLISYSQNIGVIQVTGVGSRYVVTVGGILLILMGFVPKIGALIAVIPKPVMGGALMVAWGLVIAIGTNLVKGALQSERDLFIYAVSVALGLGFVLAPKDSMTYLPEFFRLLFDAGPAVGILVAMGLNIIIPQPAPRAAGVKGVGGVAH
jgi:xanthine permease